MPSARKTHAIGLFSGLPDRYDRLSSLLSFGQDPRWRRAMVAAVQARSTDRVLDVATGTGMVARELVRRYGCSVVGLDQSPNMLAEAKRRVARDPVASPRIELVAGEAEELPFSEDEFDALTFTYLWRYVDDPARTMVELARVVRPGGVIASLDFGVPDPPVWRPLWRLYTRVGLPLAGRVFSREWYEVGRFLGPNIEELYRRFPLERQREIWETAGIGDVRQRRMSLGGGVVTWGVRDG